MIDNLAILIFGSFIVYTVYKAIQLDKITPWFGEAREKKEHPPKEENK